MSETVNGWRGSLASGRCSYDWSLNAANTKNQVGTELADQVVYLNCRVDAEGEPFDGSHNYVLHFDAGETPAVWGMWNISIYDEHMLFIPNDLGRVSIGSTTDGLTPNDDGSLDLYIQHDTPEGDHAANWLPAPDGSFNLTLRYYGPLSTVLDKTYAPPAVQRT